MKKFLMTFFKYFLFLGVGVFFVWLSIHKMTADQIEKCKESLKTAKYFLVVPVFFILSASHLSRALRWRLLMKPMGYKPKLSNTFFAVMIGYLVNLGVPRLGEVIKCTILSKYEKVPPEKLVGTIILERIVDVLCLLIVFAITLISQAKIIGSYAKETISKHFLSSSTKIIFLKFGIVIFVIAIVYFLLKYAFNKYRHLPAIQKIKSISIGIRDGIGSVKKMDNKWLFIGHTVFIWSCYVGGTYLGFFVINETAGLPFMAAFPVLAFASIGMILSPGGIGLYAFFIQEVMELYHIDLPYGFANGNLQWMAQFLIILVVGLISFILLPYINKTKDGQISTDTQ
jgi:glycosyltransferase 2 family protein